MKTITTMSEKEDILLSLSWPAEIETLGEAIRYVRHVRRMTLRQLGLAVGVSAPFLSDLEHNRRTTDRLPELAAALRVPVERLQHFSGKLSKDLRKWIEANPALVQLLRQLQASTKVGR